MVIYIDILWSSVVEWRKWKEGKVHRLLVVFPENSKDAIGKYIEQAKKFYE